MKADIVRSVAPGERVALACVGKTWAAHVLVTDITTHEVGAEIHPPTKIAFVAVREIEPSEQRAQRLLTSAKQARNRAQLNQAEDLLRQLESMKSELSDARVKTIETEGAALKKAVEQTEARAARHAKEQAKQEAMDLLAKARRLMKGERVGEAVGLAYKIEALGFGDLPLTGSKRGTVSFWECYGRALDAVKSCIDRCTGYYAAKCAENCMATYNDDNCP
jgi:hypothetical protein